MGSIAWDKRLRDLLVLLDELAATGCVVVSLWEAIDLGTATQAGRWSTEQPTFP